MSSDGDASAAVEESKLWPEFLVVFAHHPCYFNMRFQELEALAWNLGVRSLADLYVDDPRPTAMSDSPLVRVRLPSESAAHALCERAVLVKAVLDVWGEGPNVAAAVAAALAAEQIVIDARRDFVAPPKTMQIRVVHFGRTVSMDEKRVAIEQVKPVFRGDEAIDLYNSDVIVWVLEEHNHRTAIHTQGPRVSEPRRAFVARQVAGGRSLDKKLTGGDKAFFQRYDLSNRAVLGPTTMENQLAFLMVNCACVTNGQVAMDPFCGTGGLLLALSHFGARVVGAEIDIRVVKGWRVAYLKNKEAARAVASARAASSVTSCVAASNDATVVSDGRDCNAMSLAHLVNIGLAPKAILCGGVGANDCAPIGATPNKDKALQADIFTNFIQYALPSPEIVICDAACNPWRQTSCGWLDCIVTDPPYGVRAAMKKQGRDPALAKAEIRDRSTYIPSKVSYGDEELTRDLLSLASVALRDRGRLVYLAPIDLADLLGIDRSRENGAGKKPQTLHEVSMPSSRRTAKDPRLCISETTRDPMLLDEKRHLDFLPRHADLELIGASLQVLSGGLGRLLVTFRRIPRGRPP